MRRAGVGLGMRPAPGLVPKGLAGAALRKESTSSLICLPTR